MADEAGPDRGVNPVLAGATGVCPYCGDGPLFNGYLSIADACEACGRSFALEDIGDGPVAFIILIVGFAVVIPALIVEATMGWPIWLHMLIWLPLALILCLALLRPFRGVMLALQLANKAQEARLEEDGGAP